jgi:hypothetical protein
MAWAAGQQAFSVGPDGRLAASVDGAEVLAWSGDDLRPLWKDLGDAVFAGVAIDSQAVWLIDQEGTLQRRRREDGEVLHQRQVLTGRPVAIAAVDGHVLVVGEQVVHYLIGTELRAIVTLAGVVAVAISADARWAALAEGGGALTVLDLSVPGPCGRLEVGGRPSSVVWSREGFWLVAVGHRLRPVRADGRQIAAPRGCTSAPVDQLTLSAQGVIAAVRMGPNEVALLHVEDARATGTIKLGREIVGVAGGPHGLLWLGLRHGDLQRFDLLSGETTLAGSHAGRARVAFATDVRFDPADVRGMLARHLAGGEPLSVYVPPTEAEASGCSWQLALALVVSALLMAALLGWYVYG